MNTFGDFGTRLHRGSRNTMARCERPLAKFLTLMKSALVGGAVLGLIQPALAVDVVSSPEGLAKSSPGIYTKSTQGVYAALLDLDGSSPKPAPAQRDDDAFSALASFAQTASAGSKSAGEKAA